MSSNIWPHATPSHRCTVCDGPDWCTFGSVAMLCQRVESAWPAKTSGWYHYYDGNGPRPVSIPTKPRPAEQIDCAAMFEEMVSMRSNHFKGLAIHAKSIGLSMDSLESLRCVYSVKNQAFAFPMRDGDGSIIGIRLRNHDGKKWAVTGSRQGIFIPDEELKAPICFLPEGPTNTAALLTLGFFAIGRPNVLCGAEQIKVALKRLGIFRAVIVADNDELKGNGKYPGIDGAHRLKKELAGISSCIWIPPAPLKDVRDFLKAGGTKQMIESDLKGKVWTK